MGGVVHMGYNFDEVIDRKNTHSIKYDFIAERGKDIETLPMWVADMDFRIPKEISDELMKAVEHGIFGYSEMKEEYYLTLQKWFLKRFGWNIKKDWIVKTPGIVNAIAVAIQAFTKEGDGVLIQKPVYYPFFDTIKANKRKVINSPLVYTNGTYEIDFKDFEAKILEHSVKLFILCSPHNPVGRVWTKEELERIGSICIKYNVLILSDEIHADFVYPGYEHRILGSINEELLNNSIICTAPSKTFNLAGLQVSNIIIANKDLRKKFVSIIKANGYSQLNKMGLIACQAAYQFGEPWLEELKDYLWRNLSYIREFLKNRIPEIKLVEPQGTYLVWLDFRGLNISVEEIEDIVVNKAKLWLDHGGMFGEEGYGFQRINIACPKIILKSALERLEQAIHLVETYK